MLLKNSGENLNVEIPRLASRAAAALRRSCSFIMVDKSSGLFGKIPTMRQAIDDEDMATFDDDAD